MRAVTCRRSAIIAATVCFGINAGQAEASGFALIEQSVSGLGNAYAGAAALAEDASTIFWNPAGMSKLPSGKQIVVLANSITPSIKFSDGGSVAALFRTDFGNTGGDAGSTAYVPSAYFAMDMTPTVKLGFGVGAPFGLKTEYDPGWSGRFQGIKAEIMTINLNPSVSWKANDKLALGFGLDYQYGKISLLSAVNYKGAVAGTALNPLVAANAEGQNKTEVDGDAWGFNVGALFDLTPQTRLGIAYRSAIKYSSLSGTTSFSNVPAAFAASAALVARTADGAVNLTVKTPDSLAISLAHQASSRWTLLGDMTWTGWSKIQQLPLIRDTGATLDTLTFNFKDTMRYSAGANYKMSDAWTLKMGLAFDQSPVPGADVRTVRLPDNDRTWLSIGAKYRISDAGTIDFGYSYLRVKDAPINNIQNIAAAALVKGNVVGSYKSSVNILGVQYTQTF